MNIMFVILVQKNAILVITMKIIVPVVKMKILFTNINRFTKLIKDNFITHANSFVNKDILLINIISANNVLQFIHIMSYIKLF
jgi:hypothetical protein